MDKKIPFIFLNFVINKTNKIKTACQKVSNKSINFCLFYLILIKAYLKSSIFF